MKKIIPVTYFLFSIMYFRDVASFSYGIISRILGSTERAEISTISIMVELVLGGAIFIICWYMEKICTLKNIKYFNTGFRNLKLFFLFYLCLGSFVVLLPYLETLGYREYIKPLWIGLLYILAYSLYYGIKIMYDNYCIIKNYILNSRFVKN